MKLASISTAAVAGLGAITAASILAFAGPLDPPDGPVAGTYKTLAEVEPRVAINPANTPGDDNSTYRITEPGSYYLTGNLVGQAGLNGIEIAASGVTLDLNGFDVRGVPGSFSGVVTDGSQDDLHILNGVVRQWDNHGIAIGSGENILITLIRAQANAHFGIVADANATIAECMASDNGDHGIFAGINSAIRECLAYTNAGDGIRMAQDGRVENCTARENVLAGITTGNGSSVAGCISRDNGGTGISVIIGCHVRDCTVSANGADGIVAAGHCQISGNLCDSHSGGAGIRLTGVATQLTDNTATSNATGFLVERAGNLIARNGAAMNVTEFDIAPGNSTGPILDRAAMSTATNPASNFDY